MVDRRGRTNALPTPRDARAGHGGPRTHYFNADFDLSLRPRPRQVHQQGVARQVRELTFLGLLGANEGDAALVRAEVPDAFLDHLAAAGLTVPVPLLHPRLDAATRFRPFGWNAEAIELNARHGRPAPHPPLPVVRRVNSRSFALELESDLGDGVAAGRVIESPDQLEAFLSGMPESSQWVVKAEHGNAGLANRRLRRAGLSAGDRRFVEGRLAEDDRLVVEPWLPRERDWCVVFDVPAGRKPPRVHETVCTRDGAILGALFEARGRAYAPWEDELFRAAERIAGALEREGYFGPVCLDALCWRDGERSRLRPLVDLNCRRPMSDGVYRLWRKVAPDRTLYFRFFNRRKLELPADLGSALAELGEHQYDSAERSGILLASPLRIGSGKAAWRPGKLAVIFAGKDRSQVFELERRFRDWFEV